MSRRHIHRGFLFGKKIDQQSHAGNACSLSYGLEEPDASFTSTETARQDNAARQARAFSSPLGRGKI